MSDEKDRQIIALEAHIEKMEAEVAVIRVQVDALFNTFLASDPMVANGETRARRIMDVVNNFERGQWVVKWSVRTIMTLGAIATALAAIWAVKGGFK